MKWICLLALSLFLCGCSLSPEERVVGVWSGDKEQSQVPPIPIPAVEKQLRNFMSAIVLKLRSDKTFVLNTGPDMPVTGKWRLSGSEIELLPEKGKLPGILRDFMQDVKGALNKDFSRMTLEQPSPFGPFTIVLKKTA